MRERLRDQGEKTLAVLADGVFKMPKKYFQKCFFFSLEKHFDGKCNYPLGIGH